MSSYWEKRSTELELITQKKTDETVKDINRIYSEAVNSVNGRVKAVFDRYNQNNGLTETQAKQLLNTRQTAEYRKLLLDKLEKAKDKAARQAIIAILDAPAYAYRISMLEALANEIYAEAVMLGVYENKALTQRLVDIYEQSYYRRTFDIQQYTGEYYNFERLASGRVRTAISEPWNGKNYSERVWNNTEETAQKLKDIVVKGIMTGQSYRTMEQALTATLGIDSDSGARFKASRLIRTEVNYISGKATTKAYEQAEIEEYVFLATLDKKTCHDCGNEKRKSCAELDGKRFKVSEAKVGVNKHPMHPFCRCSDYPYIPGRSVGVRSARDPKTGKSIKVPADMNYQQWYEKFVDNSADLGIIEVGSEKMTISSIERPIGFPIEQRNTGKGNPNAILIFDVDLNNRQKELLEMLPEYNSRAVVPKDAVNMTDLSALTAKTGVEFAMFTRRNERLIVRGNEYMVDINTDMAVELNKNGYRWSGHTHPGLDFLAMQPSDGDYAILESFNQKNSAIYNSKGDFRMFEKRGK